MTWIDPHSFFVAGTLRLCAYLLLLGQVFIVKNALGVSWCSQMLLMAAHFLRLLFDGLFGSNWYESSWLGNVAIIVQFLYMTASGSVVFVLAPFSENQVHETYNARQDDFPLLWIVVVCVLVSAATEWEFLIFLFEFIGVVLQLIQWCKYGAPYPVKGFLLLMVASYLILLEGELLIAFSFAILLFAVPFPLVALPVALLFYPNLVPTCCTRLLQRISFPGQPSHDGVDSTEESEDRESVNYADTPMSPSKSSWKAVGLGILSMAALCVVCFRVPLGDKPVTVLSQWLLQDISALMCVALVALLLMGGRVYLDELEKKQNRRVVRGPVTDPLLRSNLDVTDPLLRTDPDATDPQRRTDLVDARQHKGNNNNAANDKGIVIQIV